MIVQNIKIFVLLISKEIVYLDGQIIGNNINHCIIEFIRQIKSIETTTLAFLVAVARFLGPSCIYLHNIVQCWLNCHHLLFL